MLVPGDEMCYASCQVMVAQGFLCISGSTLHDCGESTRRTANARTLVCEVLEAIGRVDDAIVWAQAGIGGVVPLCP